MKLEVIENFNNYTNPLGLQNCLLVIDNYHKLNFIPLQFPIIHRSPSSANASDLAFLIPSFLAVMKISFSYINYKDFASRTKPWNCEAQILLLKSISCLPVGSNRLAYNPRIFKYSWNQPESPQETLPTALSSLVLFVLWNSLSTSLTKLENQLFVDFLLRQPLNACYEYSLCANKLLQPIYLLLYVRLLTAVPSSGKGKVISCKLLCITCVSRYPSKAFEMFEIPSNDIEPTDLFHVTALERFGAFALPNAMTSWSFHPVSKWFSLHSFLKYWERCNVSMIWEEIFSLVDEHDQIALIQAHLWISAILRNFTYQADTYAHICTDGTVTELSNSNTYFANSTAKIKRETYNGYAWHAYAVSAPDQTFSVKFVACGTHDLERFAFKEIYSIYRPSVWVAILLCALVSGYILPKCATKTSTWDLYPLQLVKSILEQGNPFQDQQLETTSGRILCSALLLAAIVLSNGYKNSNVYKLITPRLPVSYNTFAELQSDSFQMYTVLGNITTLSDYFKTCETVLEWHHSEFELYEAARLVMHSNSIVLGPPNRSEVETNVKKNVCLHPKVYQSFVEVIRNLNKPNNCANNISHSQQSAKLKPRLEEAENRTLYSDLINCNKVAFFLPYKVANDMYKKLRHSLKSKNRNVHIGKETYFKQHIFFKLEGMTTPSILRRIRWIHQTGILDWWLHLVKLNNLRFSLNVDQTEVKAASMKGNVFVIFSMLVIGCVLAGFTFSVEMGYKMVNGCGLKKRIYRQRGVLYGIRPTAS